MIKARLFHKSLNERKHLDLNIIFFNEASLDAKMDKICGFYEAESVNIVDGAKR